MHRCSELEAVYLIKVHLFVVNSHSYGVTVEFEGALAPWIAHTYVNASVIM